MTDCVFCKIINKQAAAELIYEDDAMVAFNDIRPKAPVHILIVPKEHFADLNEATAAQKELLGEICLRAAALAKEKGIAASGYKIIANTGDDAGQIIHHFHFHLIGGDTIKVVV